MEGCRDHNGCKHCIDNHQRQGHGTVPLIDGNPHHSHHSRRNRELQHHPRDQTGIVFKKQMPCPKSRRRHHHMEKENSQKQGKRSLKHRPDILKTGFQRPDKGHHREHHRHKGDPFPGDLRECHSQDQTGGRHKRHMFLNLCIPSVKHDPAP